MNDSPVLHFVDTPKNYGSPCCVDPSSGLRAHQVPGGLLFETRDGSVTFVPCDANQANMYLWQVKVRTLRIVAVLPAGWDTAYLAADSADRPHVIAPDGRNERPAEAPDGPNPRDRGVAGEISVSAFRNAERGRWNLRETLALERVGPLRSGDLPPQDSIGREYAFRDIECPNETTLRLPPHDVKAGSVETPLKTLWGIRPW